VFKRVLKEERKANPSLIIFPQFLMGEKFGTFLLLLLLLLLIA